MKKDYFILLPAVVLSLFWCVVLSIGIWMDETSTLSKEEVIAELYLPIKNQQLILAEYDLDTNCANIIIQKPLSKEELMASGWKTKGGNTYTYHPANNRFFILEMDETGCEFFIRSESLASKSQQTKRKVDRPHKNKEMEIVEEAHPQLLICGQVESYYYELVE